MVNFSNPFAMYQSRGGQYGAGSWYSWQSHQPHQPHQPQNYEEQQWCGWNGTPTPTGGDWNPEPHHFPKREPGERVGEIPSPTRGDLVSPGESSPASGQQPPSAPPQPRSPFEWMRKPNYQTQPNPGKTRTKDKYRVVYTDHQRLELEKEFHYSRYITIRRKAELAINLGLSERQVKIWFQNRRAKERKQVKKREEVVMKEKGEHASLQHAQLHHASILHHQQMMNGMMHHHHYQGVLQGVPEPLVPGVPPVPPLL